MCVLITVAGGSFASAVIGNEFMARETKGYVFEDKNGLIWGRFTYTDPTSGKRHSVKRRAANKTEGREVIKKLIRDLEDQGPRSIKGDRLVFKEIADDYRDNKLIDPIYSGERKVGGLRSPSYKSHIKPLIAYFNNNKLKQITATDVLHYKIMRLATDSRRGGKMSIATVNRELALLRVIFNYARSEGWVNRSPFESKGSTLISMADEERRDRILSHPEEVRLLSACKGTREIEYERKGKIIKAELNYDFFYLKALIVAAVDTAMRKGELIKLVWDDIDLERGEILIRAMNTKIQTRRMVGITSRLRIALEDLRSVGFAGGNDIVFGVTDFKRSFETVCDVAKISGLRFHDLRHTATTRMVAAGMPIAEVMKITGHLQINTFLRYVNQTPDITRKHTIALEAYLDANKPSNKE